MHSSGLVPRCAAFRCRRRCRRRSAGTSPCCPRRPSLCCVAYVITSAPRPCALYPAGAVLLHVAGAQAVCRTQLLQASPASAGAEQWIDADTPAEACTKQLPGFDATYQLVMSDEFNSRPEDRSFE